MTTTNTPEKRTVRKRRGRGEGGVYQRESDGLWVGTVSLDFDGNGKRKRKTVYGSTKKEVTDKLDEVQTAARVGNLPDAGGLAVGQLPDRWLESRKVTMGARTHEVKESLVRVHLKPRIGGVRLAKINGVHIEALIAELRGDSVKPWAARHAIDVLDYSLSYAVKLRLIPRTPATRSRSRNLRARTLLS